LSARSILITGASSGIGHSLAMVYSRPGATLALSGRDRARLDAVAEACRGRGATVVADLVDLCDRVAMRAWTESADDRAPLDVAIANAGIAAGLEEDVSDFATTRRILEVNIMGTLNTLEPVLDRMRARRSGHVVLMGSFAAFRGIPGSQGYSASKAALKALAEGLRPQLADCGIGISLVMPGFVRTPMNEGRGFPTPLRIEAERAALIIQRGVARGRFRIDFPQALLWGSRLLALAPPLADALAARAARRGRGAVPRPSRGRKP
jgi:short-subunit dehydrogenase